MNVDVFIEARKRKGYSQSELAEGICTQVTLSRFENNGQAPSLKILIKLCQRLELPIGEIFPKIGIKNSEIIEKMNEVEFYFITSEYKKAQELLNEIKIDEEKNSEINLRYLYLKGFLMIFKKKPITDILFTFDKIILSETLAENNIYSLLAYTGVGMAYHQVEDYEKSEYYFDKVIEKIYSYPIKEIEDTWRVLNILFHSSVFYADINELASSNALLEYAISICSENHVTYYLARASFQLTLNSIAEKREKLITLELLYDARAYAKINKNKVLLQKIETLEQELKSGEN
ncbi:helix-turn-helix domain-containing protein [Vagococcus fluvialis]|uniref:helix-turn-helix domain-containing protein n=1 Tax=Vagococcus fluvialis TaxID=2738 RepID=UPI001D0AD602|nr:helix-turn-helix transcriptional regulator [Vagococcus fluvialis]MDT2747380.1 helix-turn-helix transcriptional regulator [Vagococcus fluvialis]UDM75225.1 helix-turn-helix transcriptional regulator [Vagococcus fluvialis]